MSSFDLALVGVAATALTYAALLISERWGR